MKAEKSPKAVSNKLPAMLRECFWDCDFRALRWEKDRDFIIGRVLASGPWDAQKWVWNRLGDAALREWIDARRGKGLGPRHLRFWELILKIPHRRVTAWLASGERMIWQERVRR